MNAPRWNPAVLAILLLGLALHSRLALAYPEFIAHGYSSCLTCHYNGNGGGPLNDYGRALWSAEIASRWFYPKSMSDEDLGNQSGFLGSTEMPYWLRPDIKYRGLKLNTNPGSSSGDSKYYQMQTDFGLVLQDKKQKYVGVLTVGRLVPPSEFGLGKTGLDHMFAREYYVRAEIVKTWWVYAGLMEKVFGIRNIDHTSYQRAYQGFGVVNNDPNGISESQGVVLQKIEDKWEVTLNGFFGNPYDSTNYKQSGASMMSEFNVGENQRLGASLYHGKSNVLQKDMAAIHYRQQIEKGSSLMFEWGLIQDTQAGGTAQTGSYNLLQGMIGLTRGYNLLTTVERYNAEFKSSSPDQWKWGFGFLLFPLPRFELRAEAVNTRQFSSQQSANDSWALEGQIHVSL